MRLPGQKKSKHVWQKCRSVAPIRIHCACPGYFTWFLCWFGRILLFQRFFLLLNLSLPALGVFCNADKIWNCLSCLQNSGDTAPLLLVFPPPGLWYYLCLPHLWFPCICYNPNAVWCLVLTSALSGSPSFSWHYIGGFSLPTDTSRVYYSALFELISYL